MTISPAPEAATHRLSGLLIGGGVALALAAGLLLWQSEGTRLFADTVFTSIMNCF